MLISVASYSEGGDSYNSFLSINVSPGVDLPVAESDLFFNPGLYTGASVRFSPKSVSSFFLFGSFDFTQNPRDEVNNLTKLGLTLGGGINYSLLPWLSLNGMASGGFSFCTMETDAEPVAAGIPVIKLSAGPSFDILPFLSLNLDLSYQGYLGLSNSLIISAGITYHFEDRPKNQGPPVLEGLPPNLINLEFDTIFPVFYKHYDDHPAGRAILFNPREEPITDITLDFFVKQYMDTPKKCDTPETLAPGETANVEIMALFNNSVLEVTEGTKVAAELTLTYKVNGIEYSDSFSETMRLLYRNAMTWDDDRRAAAFVTAKDPAIMSFSKNVASMLQGVESPVINKNLQRVMALHGALTHYGMTYVIDPTTPFSELSEQTTATDFLQFPRETLEYRAGDCDDLSILHCALLEALGIETAFVTVPDHIFIAFGLGMTSEEAIRTFTTREDLILIDGKAWIPLEITALKETFLEAWELGARQWRQYAPKGQTGFFPICSAWEQYEPVGLPGFSGNITLPPKEFVVASFKSEMSAFVSREMAPRLQRIESEIERTQGSPRSYNKQGVLYARFGLFEDALDSFTKSLEGGDYFPSLMNLGNIYFLSKEMEKALEYYNLGYSLIPDNPNILLCLARTNYVLEEFESANLHYANLQKVKPELAAQFAYLEGQKDDAQRAASINDLENRVLWEDEE